LTKFTLWIAALGVSALGSSAVNAQSMTLTSSDINEGATIVNEQVFKGFGCTGSNVSPALSWSGAPSGTKSFAVGWTTKRASHRLPCKTKDRPRVRASSTSMRFWIALADRISSPRANKCFWRFLHS
jgi:hypothetical protein